MGLNELIEDLKQLINNDEVTSIVNRRIKEFKENHEGNSEKWFEELVFCILTANSSAITGLKCIEELKKNNLILNGSLGEVENILRRVGHRFAKKRAEYIIEARKYKSNLKDILTSIRGINNKREWLARNIKGIGFKEASHFLRNVGYFDVAIIDRHVIKVLTSYQILNPITKKRTITPKQYLKIEDKIKRIARKLKLKPGILDLYLWYMDTGKILK